MNRLRLICIVSLFLVLSNCPAQAPKAQESVYDMLMRSTVFIVSPVPGERNVVMGSGSLISWDREKGRYWILTNYHVVTNLPKTFIFFPQYENNALVEDRRRYFQEMDKNQSVAIPAKAVVKVESKDLAILEFNLPKGTKVGNIIPISLATKQPKPGDNVHTLGNPGAGTLWSYTKGTVRNQGSQRNFKASMGEGKFLNVSAKVLDTSNPTNQGDSGGPLANDQGEMIGVTQGAAMNANQIATFIHMDEVRDLMAQNKLKPFIRIPVSTSSAKAEREPAKETASKEKTKDPEMKTENKVSAKEQQAQSLLRFAKDRVDENDSKSAIQSLEEILKDHPKTDAAKEAKELLNKLKK